MSWGIHSNSLRYALALWLATVLALLIAFVVQLEPAQWAGITVWIIFIQVPGMNYSKILWWSFGTNVGALMAVVLTVCFNQTPELLLLFLGLWLAVCAGYAPLVTSYRTYGAVLAGYTCAIVTMSAVDHPDMIFRLAATRISCIYIGMASAIVMINLLLPKHRHWGETRHRLGEHFKATLLQAAKALEIAPGQPVNFTWRHMVDRLSTLEHTLDVSTAESADARRHAPQARCLVAALFDLLARAQAVEIHLSRADAVAPADEVRILLSQARTLLMDFATTVSEGSRSSAEAAVARTVVFRQEISIVRKRLPDGPLAGMASNHFICDRLDELLADFSHAAQDWAGMFGTWTAERSCRLTEHKDYRSACIYGLRMFLAMCAASAFWFLSRWPSGSQLILFIAVVCSLLSMVDEAPLLGMPFLKSAAFCAIMAYIETFWLFQRPGGFVILALMLGVFLLPAAHAYRHPRLIGGAVVSMLIFYGLAMPANEMHYDIVAFLNNGLALLAAAAGGFFAFHVVPSLTPAARRFWLLHAVRSDLGRQRRARGALADEGWTSCMFDRLRLLHRAADRAGGGVAWLEAENEMLISLQLGLRQHGLFARLKAGDLPPDVKAAVVHALEEFRTFKRHPNVVALVLRSLCAQFENVVSRESAVSRQIAGALAELQEMTRLLETSTRLYRR